MYESGMNVLEREMPSREVKGRGCRVPTRTWESGYADMQCEPEDRTGLALKAGMGYVRVT